jgi:hypothetical protein
VYDDEMLGVTFDDDGYMAYDYDGDGYMIMMVARATINTQTKNVKKA